MSLGCPLESELVGEDVKLTLMVAFLTFRDSADWEELALFQNHWEGHGQSSVRNSRREGTFTRGRGQGGGDAGKATVLVALSCLTLCKPVDSSPPGSSVHGILQARTLE